MKSFFKKLFLEIRKIFNSAARNLLRDRWQKKYYVGNYSVPSGFNHHIYTKKDKNLFESKYIPFWFRRLIFNFIFVFGILLILLYLLFNFVYLAASTFVDVSNPDNVSLFFATSAQVLSAIVALPLAIILAFVQSRFSQLGLYSFDMIMKDKPILVYLVFSLFAIFSSLYILVLPGDYLLATKLIVIFDGVALSFLLIFFSRIGGLFKSANIENYFSSRLYDEIHSGNAIEVYDLLVTIRKYYLREVKGGSLNNVRWVNHLISNFLKDYIWYQKYYHSRIDTDSIRKKYGYGEGWFEQQLVQTLSTGLKVAIQNHQFEIAKDINKAIVSVLYETVNFPNSSTENMKLLLSQFGKEISYYSKVRREPPFEVFSQWSSFFAHLCCSDPFWTSFLINQTIDKKISKDIGYYVPNLLFFSKVVSNAILGAPRSSHSRKNCISLLESLFIYKKNIDELFGDFIDSDEIFVENIMDEIDVRIFLLIQYSWLEKMVSIEDIRGLFPKKWRRDTFLLFSRLVDNPTYLFKEEMQKLFPATRGEIADGDDLFERFNAMSLDKHRTYG